MALLEQLSQLALTFPWFPTVVFLGMVVGLYCLLRPAALAPDLTIGDEALAPPVMPKEQRVLRRRNGNPVEVYVAPPEAKEDPGVGSVLDRSMGGMRLAVYHDTAVGTILAIRPVRADNMVPWVELEVRSCKPSTEMPGQFELGCQYVKSPHYSIQLLFG